MAKARELRNLTVTKIALVRKGYRPVNDGARIEIVKAEEDPTMGMEHSGAQEGAKAPENTTIVERFVNAMQGLFGTDSVEKAQAAQLAAAAAEADATPATEAAAAAEPLAKADGGNECPGCGAAMPEGAKFCPNCGQAAGAVAKAEGDAIGRLQAALDELKAAQEANRSAVEKAIMEHSSAPTAETLAALMDERISAALEPVVKAFEDYGIGQARRPLTPNVTAAIKPTANGAGPDEKQAAVKGMQFGDAVRYLANH